MWGDCPKADLMDAWGEALAGVSPDFIRDAISKVAAAYPSWPPTLGEFVALCRPGATMPAHQLLLPTPWPDEPINPKVQAMITEAFAKQTQRDPKQWARDILEEARRGEYRYAYGIQCAKEALRATLTSAPALSEALH